MRMAGPTLFWTVALAVTLLGGVVAGVVTWRDGGEAWRFYVDANAIGDRPGWWGVGAVIGYLLWAATVAIACFARAVSRGRPDERRGLLGGAALLSSILLVDDVLMLHERFGPLGERCTFCLYAAIGLTVLWRWRRTIRAQAPALLITSIALLGMSVAWDVAMPSDWQWAIVIEDTLKLLGLLLWLAYFARLAREVTRPIGLASAESAGVVMPMTIAGTEHS